MSFPQRWEERYSRFVSWTLRRETTSVFYHAKGSIASTRAVLILGCWNSQARAPYAEKTFWHWKISFLENLSRAMLTTLMWTRLTIAVQHTLDRLRPQGIASPATSGSQNNDDSSATASTSHPLYIDLCHLHLHTLKCDTFFEYYCAIASPSSVLFSTEYYDALICIFFDVKGVSSITTAHHSFIPLHTYQCTYIPNMTLCLVIKLQTSQAFYV